MADTIAVSVAEDFSRHPTGRFRSDGPDSGERFRKEFLVPELERHHTLIVDLDGTEGYDQSFLEEAFGGLVRSDGYLPEDLRKRMQLKSDRDASLVQRVWSYVENARPAAGTA
jgi:STAS-like domain of unknown function (DUF4325)